MAYDPQTDRPMTVRELRAALADLPDNLPVAVWNDEYGEDRYVHRAQVCPSESGWDLARTRDVSPTPLPTILRLIDEDAMHAARFADLPR